MSSDSISIYRVGALCAILSFLFVSDCVGQQNGVSGICYSVAMTQHSEGGQNQAWKFDVVGYWNGDMDDVDEVKFYYKRLIEVRYQGGPQLSWVSCQLIEPQAPVWKPQFKTTFEISNPTHTTNEQDPWLLHVVLLKNNVEVGTANLNTMIDQDGYLDGAPSVGGGDPD